MDTTETPEEQLTPDSVETPEVVATPAEVATHAGYDQATGSFTV